VPGAGAGSIELTTTTVGSVLGSPLIECSADVVIVASSSEDFKLQSFNFVFKIGVKVGNYIRKKLSQHQLAVVNYFSGNLFNFIAVLET